MITQHKKIQPQPQVKTLIQQNILMKTKITQTLTKNLKILIKNKLNPLNLTKKQSKNQKTNLFRMKNRAF